MGRKVQLTKRISLHMTIVGGNEATHYADLVKGTIGYVEGMLKNLPVISFEIDGKDRKLAATAAIKPANLTFDVKEEGASSSSSGGGAAASKKALAKNLDFLKSEDAAAAETETIEVHDKWCANVATTSMDTKVKNLHSRLGMSLAAIIEAAPVYSQKDFYVVSRNNKIEVWAARDFGANTIVLAPETTEWKERLWSKTRSVLVKYGTMYHDDFK